MNDLELNLQSRYNNGIEFEYDDDEVFHSIQLLVLLYADDTVIMADSPESLQKSLKNFLEYCKTWGLTINYDKTKVLIFGTRKRNAFKFMMEGNEIEQVTNYRYLGVIMSNNGSFFKCKKKCL